MKKRTLHFYLITLAILMAGCTHSDSSEEESLKDSENEVYIDQLVNQLENPPEATKKEDVVITLGNAASIEELLIGGRWKDADNVGMDISFTKSSLMYYIEGYDTSEESWELTVDCEGEASPEGPYLKRGQGEHAFCFLIVKLNENALILEDQLSRIQMAFKR